MTTPADAGEPLPDVCRTSGRSMAPLIHAGATVVLRRTAPAAVVPGDIIVFLREGKLIAHRLLAVRGQDADVQLREKGDNVHRATWIPGSSLRGKAIELRQGHWRRNLELEPGRRRLRWLMNFSRWEGDAVERYVAAKAQGRGVGRLRWLLLPLAALAAPARWLCFRLLLTVYPRRQAIDDRPALQYMLGLFRNLFTNSVPEAIPEIQDWCSVAEAAAAHGVQPLLARMPPAAIPRPAWPAHLAEQGRRQTYRIALQHTLAKPALRAAARALTEAGLPYAVLKGPALYEALYQNVFPREYEDLDILVARQQVPTALAALQSVGYTVIGGRLNQAFLRLGHFHLALRSARPDWPPIELHWSWVDRGNLYRLPDNEGLARRRDCGTGAEAFSVLAPEDQLIYLCLHAAKHAPLNQLGLRQGCPPVWFLRACAGNRLLWFADIALLLRRHGDQLDWAAMLQRVRDWNVLDAVGDCLRVLDLLAPASPARFALNKLDAGDTARAPAASVQERLPRPASRGRLLDWTMRVQPFLLFRPIRILLIGEILLPAPDRLLAYYRVRSRWHLPWLYVSHPFHMAGRLLGRAGSQSVGHA